MYNWKAFLGPMRVPFLLLTPACVVVGLGSAMWTTGHVNILEFLLVLIGSLAGHISVNAYNEYFDFRSGLDMRTVRTPFSGGSGTLQALPQLAPSVFIMATGTAGIAALVDLYFVLTKGWALLPLTMLGLVIAYTYTNWLTKNPLVCLLTPGTGFGLIFVLSTNFALTGRYSWPALVASLVPFFLVSNLLLLNQFPDVDADRTVGKKHFPLVIGRRASAYIYGAFLLAAYLSVIAGIILGYLPVTTLIALATLPLAVRAFNGALQWADDIPHLIPILGLNVQIVLLTPVLLAIGLLVG